MYYNDEEAVMDLISDLDTIDPDEFCAAVDVGEEHVEKEDRGECGNDGASSPFVSFQSV